MKKVLALILSVVLLSGVWTTAKWVAPQQDALVRLHEDVRREWAQVDVLLQRRYDLIPNLVSVIERFATGQEKEIVVQLNDSYTGYRSAQSVNDKIAASGRTEGCLRQIVAFGGLYPSLASGGQFSSLLASLERTEDALAAQRMKYNAAVAELNTALRTVNGRLANLVAGVPSFSYYELPPAAKEGSRIDYKSNDPSAARMNVVPTPVDSAAKPAPASVESAATASPAPADSAGKPPSDRPRLRLSGVVQRSGGGRPTALVALPDGSLLTLQEGHTVPELKMLVETIEPQKVTLRALDAAGKPTEERIVVWK